MDEINSQTTAAQIVKCQCGCDYYAMLDLEAASIPDPGFRFSRVERPRGATIVPDQPVSGVKCSRVFQVEFPLFLPCGNSQAFTVTTTLNSFPMASACIA